MDIKVTAEMVQLITDWFEDPDSGRADLNNTIRAIIELHEQSKPKPKPVGYGLVIKGVLHATKDEAGSVGFVPLYTTPIQKPLSDDEIEKLVPWQGNPKDPFFNRIEFARAIEQANGII